MSIKRLSKREIELGKKKLLYKKNPIKFIEDFVYIPTTGGSRKFKLYKQQKKIIREFFNNHHLVLLKSRQIGMSTLTQAIITYICVFHTNCVMGIVSRDGREASDFCRKVQNMLSQLPNWIKPEYKNKSIQYFVMENGCELHTATVSPINPTNVLRGKSISLLVVDEAAFIKHIDEAWTGIQPALSRAQKDAEGNGVPFGTVILSTPNKTQGPGKWYFQQWQSAIKGDSIFKPHKIHWSEIEDYKNDPAWYDTQCMMLNNDKNKIAQELDLKFVGSDNCLFEEKVQTELQNCTTIPETYISTPKNMGKIWIFKKPNRKNFHVIGVDPSSGASEDNAAIQVIDYETMEQVMEYCHKISPQNLAEIVKIINIHCPHNIVVIENNAGYGQATIHELENDPDVHFNIYGEYKKIKGTSKFIPGLNTNTKTRPLILDALFECVNFDPQTIKSERLSSELLSLTNRRNKIEAEEGFHDDLALAFGFCCYMRKYCHDTIGDTDPLSDDINDNILMRGPEIQRAYSMNDDKSPLKHIRMYAENLDDIRKEVDKYLRATIMAGDLSGKINTLELIGDE